MAKVVLAYLSILCMKFELCSLISLSMEALITEDQQGGLRCKSQEVKNWEVKTLIFFFII